MPFRGRKRARRKSAKKISSAALLVEMHREAQTFFVQQLGGTPEGKAARAYLEDRGLDKDAIARFGIGYAPSGGRRAAAVSEGEIQRAAAE